MASDSQTPSNNRSAANKRSVAEPTQKTPAARSASDVTEAPRLIHTEASRVAVRATAINTQLALDINASTRAHAPNVNITAEPAPKAAQTRIGVFLKNPAMPRAVKASPAPIVQRRNCGASPSNTLDHMPFSSMAHSWKAASRHAMSTMNDSTPAAATPSVSPRLNHDRAEIAPIPAKNSTSAVVACPLLKTSAASTRLAAAAPTEPSLS
jgi:hypothetical protein